MNAEVRAIKTPAERAALRIRINDENTIAGMRQARRKVHADRRLSTATFLICYS